MLKFHQNVRRSNHGDIAILYHLKKNYFLKLPKSGVDFLENFLNSNGNGKEMLGQLNEKDYQRFLSLLGYLKQQEYILEDESIQEPELDKKTLKSDKKAKQQFLEINRSAYYELTNQCNLKCVFCYTNPHAVTERIKGDFSLSKKIIDRASKLNIDTMVLSGGEPLLREDIFKIIQYAKKKMKKVAMATNGILIDETMAHNLKKSGIDLVSISIESTHKDIHESLRGEGTFDKTLAAIQHMKDAGFTRNSLNIVATINRKNFHVLDEFQDFADRLDVNMNLSIFKPVGRGKNHDDLQLTTEQYCKFILAQNENGAKMLIKEIHETEEPVECISCSKMMPTLKNTCGIVKDTLAIKCDGTLVPCHLFFSVTDPNMIIGSILDKSIGDKLWNFYLDKVPTVEEKEECNQCSIRYFCGGSCYAPGYFKDGSFFTPHPSCDRFKIYFSALIDSLGTDDEFATFRDTLDIKLTEYHREAINQKEITHESV